MISDNMLNDINSAYNRLEAKMAAVYGALSHRMFELEWGWYNNHYSRGEDGEWDRQAYPIPVASVKGLCDIEISFTGVSVSTKLERTRALEYSFEKFAGYDFEAYGVEDYLCDYYIKGQTVSQMKENIRKSNESEIGFSFTFSEDIDGEKICEFVSLLQSEGFYY